MLRIQNITIDCNDPKGLAQFWAKALDWQITGESDDEVCIAAVPEGTVFEASADGQTLPYPDVLFIRTPDTKVVKNRLHMCLRPATQAEEVARLEALGATKVEIGQSAEPGATWVVMTDPEGNEFCVLRASTAQGE
ncbi:MAG: VOC family protein [Actinomycetales bacterium]|nr:VOC family protein [Actinomycetales bacterium]